VGRPRKHAQEPENLLPAKAGVDQVTYLAKLTEKCTADDYGAIIANLKRIATGSDEGPAIKASKLLLDTFMDLVMAFPSQQHPEEEGKRAKAASREALDRLMDALEEANRSTPMTTVEPKPT
jgi:hypothetical protein